jgi:hypothetical protein
MTHDSPPETIIRNIQIALGLIAIVALIIMLMSSCKGGDYVVTTPDGWRIHSNVPIDSSLILNK